MTNRSEAMWEKYRDKVYKANLPLAPSQERECSRAFYAGMEASFRELVKVSYSVSDEELAAERAEEFRESIVEAAKNTL